MQVNGITVRDTSQATNQKARVEADGRVYVNLPQLLRIQHKATGFSFKPRQPLSSILAGQHASKIRGRGLDFEELRAYRHGDDIRSIDWKVTARTRKPHVRVFTEERQRRAVLIVDQMKSMFYGTRVFTKSVTAAHAAALAAWRVLSMGDSIGAVVFNDNSIVEIRPHRSRQNVIQILRAVVDMNQQLSVSPKIKSNPAMFNRVLGTANRTCGHDFLVIVISDFEGADETTRRHLVKLSQHNDVICALVHDQSVTELPLSGDYIVSDGELQVELDFGKEKVRRKLLDVAKGRINRVLAWQQEIGVPILPLNTVEDVADQVRYLIGSAIAARRR